MQALVRTVRGSFARRINRQLARSADSAKRAVAALLVVAALTPTLAKASPKPLDAGTVHVKVIRRGIGNFIGVQLADGIQVFGRILAVGDHSFTLQLHNDPQPTEIFYVDVTYLVTGFTPGQKVFMVSGIAATAGLATWGFIHIHNLQQKQLTLPPNPTAPPGAF